MSSREVLVVMLWCNNVSVDRTAVEFNRKVDVLKVSHGKVIKVFYFMKCQAIVLKKFQQEHFFKSFERKKAQGAWTFFFNMPDLKKEEIFFISLVSL